MLYGFGLGACCISWLWYDLYMCLPVLMNTMLVLWQAKRYYEISHPRDGETEQVGTTLEEMFSTLRLSVRLSNVALREA